MKRLDFFNQTSIVQFHIIPGLMVIKKITTIDIVKYVVRHLIHYRNLSSIIDTIIRN